MNRNARTTMGIVSERRDISIEDRIFYGNIIGHLISPNRYRNERIYEDSVTETGRQHILEAQLAQENINSQAYSAMVDNLESNTDNGENNNDESQRDVIMNPRSIPTRMTMSLPIMSSARQAIGRYERIRRTDSELLVDENLRQIFENGRHYTVQFHRPEDEFGEDYANYYDDDDFDEIGDDDDDYYEPYDEFTLYNDGLNDIDEYSKIDKIDEDQICIICTNEFKAGNEFRTMTCKHEYCLECSSKWFSKCNRCPLCNHELKINESVSSAM